MRDAGVRGARGWSRGKRRQRASRQLGDDHAHECIGIMVPGRHTHVLPVCREEAAMAVPSSARHASRLRCTASHWLTSQDAQTTPSHEHHVTKGPWGVRDSKGKRPPGGRIQQGRSGCV